MSASWHDADSSAQKVAFSMLDPRIEASRSAVLHVADLVDNVIQGISANREIDRPAQANQRLLDTAASLSVDILRYTKVGGRSLFAFTFQPTTSKVSAYSQSNRSLEVPPLIVRKSAGLIKESVSLFRNLSIGSTQDAEKSTNLLSHFSFKLRQVTFTDPSEEANPSLDVIV